MSLFEPLIHGDDYASNCLECRRLHAWCPESVPGQQWARQQAQALSIIDAIAAFALTYQGGDQAQQRWPNDPDGGALRIAVALRDVLPKLGGHAIAQLAAALAPAETRCNWSIKSPDSGELACSAPFGHSGEHAWRSALGDDVPPG